MAGSENGSAALGRIWDYISCGGFWR